jgi:hypothetical protein
VNTDKIVPKDGDTEAPDEPGRTQAPAPVPPNSSSHLLPDEAAPGVSAEERERRLQSLKAEIARLRGG